MLLFGYILVCLSAPEVWMGSEEKLKCVADIWVQMYSPKGGCVPVWLLSDGHVSDIASAVVCPCLWVWVCI